MFKEVLKHLLKIIVKWAGIAVLIRIIWIIGLMWFRGWNLANELFWFLVIWVLLISLFEAMKLFVCRNPLAELLELQKVFSDNEPTLDQIDAYVDLARKKYINTKCP